MSSKYAQGLIFFPVFTQTAFLFFFSLKENHFTFQKKNLKQ